MTHIKKTLKYFSSLKLLGLLACKTKLRAYWPLLFVVPKTVNLWIVARH